MPGIVTIEEALATAAEEGMGEGEDSEVAAMDMLDLYDDNPSTWLLVLCIVVIIFEVAVVFGFILAFGMPRH